MGNGQGKLENVGRPVGRPLGSGNGSEGSGAFSRGGREGKFGREWKAKRERKSSAGWPQFHIIVFLKLLTLLSGSEIASVSSSSGGFCV